MLAALVAAGAFATTATAATAGARFVYEQCDPALPGGNPPAYDFHSQAAYAPFQNCASAGGAVGVTQTGQVQTSPGWVEFGARETPGGFVESVTLTAFANFQPGNGGHVGAEGWPASGLGPTPRYFFIRSEPGYCLFCEGGGGGAFTAALTCSATCEPGGAIGAQYIAAVEVDPHPPMVATVEGPLLSGIVLRGHQALTATATDTGGGVSVVEALVNGVVAPGATPGACAVAKVENPSYHGLAAWSPRPCPATLPGSWNLDTAEYPFHEGTNTVQVCASDFATTGPPNTTCSPVQTVEVNNSCTESPVAGGQVLGATFAHSGSEATVVPFGQAAEVSGTLADQAGDPIPGATICVQAQLQGEAGEPAPIATATTDAAGAYTYEVPPGPNRRLLVGYRHDSFQVGKTLTVGTHARPTLILSKGRVKQGGRVKITGELPGPSAAGRVLVLQASSLHGRRWLTFRRVTTGPRGGYRARYRFGHTTHTITYRIRSVVPAQAGYDYEAGVSVPARVKVRTVTAGHGKKKKTEKKHTHGGRGR
jgi:hypothetical protein